VHKWLEVAEDRLYVFIGFFARNYPQNIRTLLGGKCLSDLVKSAKELSEVDDRRLKAACWGVRECLRVGVVWRDMEEVTWVLDVLGNCEPECSFHCRKEVILLFFESVKWLQIVDFSVELRAYCFAMLSNGAALEYDEELCGRCICVLIELKHVLVALGLSEGEEMEDLIEIAASHLKMIRENGGDVGPLIEEFDLDSA
jgi:hypothetical protein